MKRSTAIKLGCGLLSVALFMERFCFVVSIYKVQNYTLLLLIWIIGLNCGMNWLANKMHPKKTKKRLAELFDFHESPQINNFVIFILGLIDMVYMCLFFWPAKNLPIWLLIAML